jgi:hypothetical protein
MNPNNELIAAIDNARNTGSTIKTIRRQKHDPNNFYMTTIDNRQVGPVKCEGSADELNRKFGEAQSYLGTLKQTTNTNCGTGCNSHSNSKPQNQQKRQPTPTNA